MSQRAPDDPWAVLGMTPTRDLQAIRQAYLRQVRLHHPDQFGLNPGRYRAQEDQMRRINWAYQEAARQARAPQRKSPDPPSSSRSPATHCVEHGKIAEHRCRECDKGLCRRCVGQKARLCNRHLAQIVTQDCRRRATREWIPFLSVLTCCSFVGVPSTWTMILLSTYVFSLGLLRIRHSGWRGLFYLWLFPIGLMLSGLYSLYQSLDQWMRASYDESLWQQFLR
jgi:hypothetical protein